MIRLSATQVEAIEYAMAHETAIAQPGTRDLAERLAHVAPATPAMERGKAFHAWLEQGGPPGQVRFGPGAGWIASEIPAIRPYCREVKTTRDLVDLDGEQITLSGVADGIVGRRIVEFKTTAKKPDPTRYYDHFQWRAYLALWPDCTAVDYHVFQIAGEETMEIRDYAHATYHRYGVLEDDVEERLYAAKLEVAWLIAEGWLSSDPDTGRLRPGERLEA